MGIQNEDGTERSNLSAVIIMIAFMLVLIIGTIVYFKIRDKRMMTPPEPPVEVTDTTPEGVTTPVDVEGMPFDDLMDSLFNDITQILGCNDIHYFVAQTPGIYTIDLADARTTLGKSEALSYSIWYANSNYSTAQPKGDYVMDITLSSSDSGYDELLVYFYVREYNGVSSIESISFDYVSID